MSLTKVTTNGLTDETIDAGKIADGGLANADIAPGTITSAKLAGSIANAKLANESITINSSATALGASISAGKISWQSVVTGDTTMVAGRGYFVDTSSSAVTMTLPSSAAAGDTVVIKDYAANFGTNSVTIARNSHNIQGVANDSEIKTNRAAVKLVYVDATKGWLFATESNISDLVATFINATGGTVTTSGNFKIHTFTGDGNFIVSTVGNPVGGPSNVDHLVVAGGGGGGSRSAGGGGAGGYRTTFPSPSCNAGAFPISIQTYPITVGGGGAGDATGSSCATKGASGSNSVFATITSAGGGGGNGTGGVTGGNGGSGGGGNSGSSGTPNAGGSGNTPPVSPSQGNNGGTGFDAPGSNEVGAGGGGAGAVGGDATSGTGGNGGNGSPNQITGSNVTYAGGGGGSSYKSGSGTRTPGSGGSGGGGAGGGGTPDANGVSGTANTGGGGGAGCTSDPAGAGGSGVVIIRYKFQ